MYVYNTLTANGRPSIIRKKYCFRNGLVLWFLFESVVGKIMWFFSQPFFVCGFRVCFTCKASAVARSRFFRVVSRCVVICGVRGGECGKWGSNFTLLIWFFRSYPYIYIDSLVFAHFSAQTLYYCVWNLGCSNHVSVSMYGWYFINIISFLRFLNNLSRKICARSETPDSLFSYYVPSSTFTHYVFVRVFVPYLFARNSAFHIRVVAAAAVAWRRLGRRTPPFGERRRPAATIRRSPFGHRTSPSTPDRWSAWSVRWSCRRAWHAWCPSSTLWYRVCARGRRCQESGTRSQVRTARIPRWESNLVEMEIST